ncbi:MAG TPA: M23 family metallopeptidase [Anaerolineae bacterium]|nr:M23 family metallopeptidase [Anaerolineae bacterium]
MPGKEGSVIGVGFHEAERREAVAMSPTVACFNKETTATVRNAVMKSKGPVLFVMLSRGRGSAPTSAADIAMAPHAEVYSPVDGVVTKVKTYNLYNKVTDYHVEIQPDGYPDLRVAIIHIDNIQLKVGQRVKRRETQIGWLRPLPQITSQINRYLPEQADHIHIQVNPATAAADFGS